MDHLSIWPYFGIITISMMFCSALLPKWKFYDNQLKQNKNQRLPTLDGLRGYLALSVFFHHGVITYYYYVNGVWRVPPSSFYTLLGQVAVAIFFMITGFLFWEKAMTSGINIKKFATSRIKRIVPLYIFSVLCVIAIVLIATNFSLNVNIFSFVKQLIRWFSFSFLRTPDINGFKDTFTIESVYWTLRWEWLFYLLLPVFSVFSKRPFLVVFLLSVYCLATKNIHFSNFVIGMIAATILPRLNFKGATERSFYLISNCCLVVLFLLYDTGYGPFQTILMASFFLSVLHGNNLFGLLTCKPACLLGLVSYSVYLMHNIIIFALFGVFNNKFHSVASLVGYEFWGLMSIGSILVVITSLLTFKFIEHRFYAQKISVKRNVPNTGTIESVAS